MSRPASPRDGLVPDPYGAHEMPVYQTSSFSFPSVSEARAAFEGRSRRFVYSRAGNPTVVLWERRLSELEAREHGAEVGSLAFASGMGAVSAAVLACLRSGDHAIAMEPLYGGTHALFRDLLPRFGVGATLVRIGEWESLERALQKPRTAVLFLETPANPTLAIVDLERAAAMAHRFGARLIVDNTFATPVLQRPLELGADLVVHSSTKYLGGHGTALGGSITTRDIEFLAGPIHEARSVLGACASPHDAWLLLQGSKTLELRVERQSQSAASLAAVLAQSEAVGSVLYPGLATDPGHAIASRQMRGFGAMIAVRFRGGCAAVDRFIDSLELARCAVSLGCTETLVEHPASMTHATMSAEERDRCGIADDLVRLSIGLEPLELLRADVLGALAAVREAAGTAGRRGLR